MCKHSCCPGWGCRAAGNVAWSRRTTVSRHFPSAVCVLSGHPPCCTHIPRRGWAGPCSTGGAGQADIGRGPAPATRSALPWLSHSRHSLEVLRPGTSARRANSGELECVTSRQEASHASVHEASPGHVRVQTWPALIALREKRGLAMAYGCLLKSPKAPTACHNLLLPTMPLPACFKGQHIASDAYDLVIAGPPLEASVLYYDACLGHVSAANGAGNSTVSGTVGLM